MVAIDKHAHFWAGMSVFLACSTLGLSPVTALFVTAVAAALKEVRDYWYGTPDRWDFVATLAGGVAGLILVGIANGY